MKTRTIIRFAVMSLAMVSMMACHKDRKPKPLPDSEPEFTEGLSVKADYYGDAYQCGYDDYVMYFQLGQTTLNNEGQTVFVKDGIELSLDILVRDGGVNGFPAGKYTITDGSYKSAGILPSVPVTLKEYLQQNGQSIAGYSAAQLASIASYGDTSFYVQTDANNWWLSAVDKAELEVSVNGAEYTISVSFEASGDTYNYKYKGSLMVNDARSQEPTPDPAETYTIEGVNEVYAYNDGHVWGSSTDDWFLYLYNDNSNGLNEYVVIEFVATTGSSKTELPTGKFTVPSDFYDVEVIPAKTLCPIYMYENSYYGTYYGQGDTVVIGATDGTLNISKSGTTYTVNLEIYDGESNSNFVVEYTGGIQVSADDYVVSTKAMTQRPAAKRAGASKLRRNVDTKRSVMGVRRMTL